MSCYQVLALNNNTGDLQITQGNTLNLAQVIQNFSVKTPVVDFKLDGSVLSLYYRDATGALQLKTVTLPATGNNNTSISVASTSSITASITAGVIKSSVNISTAAGNTLSLNPDGLYVPPADENVPVQSSSSIALVNNVGTITASAIISPASGNTLTVTDAGLYVPPNSLNASQVRAFFSAVSPILFDNSTGIISEPQATTSVDGYLSASDWTLFKSKVDGGLSIGSSSSTPIYKQEVAGILQFRPVAAGTGIGVSLIGDDIIISTTATVPAVNAGGTQNIVTPATSATLSGTSSVSNGSISANQWLQLSGPNLATISDASILNPVVSGLIVGVYRFRLLTHSSTGLINSDIASVTVTSGSITLDTIYIGVQSSSTPPGASAVAAGTSSMQNGANDVAADWTSLSAATPVYCWFAIPNLGGTYFKTKYFFDALNHGNIGGSTDLFGAYTQVTIGSIVYNVGMTQYPTQFVTVGQLQA